MMDTILRALGLIRRPSPPHVKAFATAKRNLNTRLGDAAFADMMNGMATGRATRRKKHKPKSKRG